MVSLKSKGQGLVTRRAPGTYQQVAHASNDALHELLVAKDIAVIGGGTSQQIPEVEQSLEQIPHLLRVVCLAVVSRKPTPGAGHQQGAVGPAIGVDRMHQHHVALGQGERDGRLARDIVGLKGVKGAQEVVKDGVVSARRGIEALVVLGRGRRRRQVSVRVGLQRGGL